MKNPQYHVPGPNLIKSPKSTLMLKSYQRLTFHKLEPDNILVCLVMIQLSSHYNSLGWKQN